MAGDQGFAFLQPSTQQGQKEARRSAPIQKLAKWDFEWADSWSEPKFSKYRWKDQEHGIVTIIGDKLKLQNRFGA
ncbi:hypothetical protein FHT82_004838 [Rhizobium sp. BK275]|uniref:hypothetical protein n=1 Tax=Rhizobium sp. BK275 TaxID=2587077 RepID=UPI001613F547|nr:hypothetical protein [Rhizobium sp. BK275]MBB3392057.1 hypothetical protein [Rhizobium sp. BK275]